MLGFRAGSQPVSEGFVKVDAVIGEDSADCAGPVAPMLHDYCVLIGPMVACFAVGVGKPFVCVWAESISARVCDV